MAAKKPKPPKAKKAKDGKSAQAYDHKEEKLLLRPDVGLQPQFKQKKRPKTYRYDPSLDPALSWDINADRERAEALIAKIESAKDVAEAKLAAPELRQMSRPFLDWAGKAGRHEFTVPTFPLFVHERLSTQAILQSVKSHKRDRQQTLALFADEELDVADRLLKAYEHETNWVNRLTLGDSLVVMNSLLQYEGLGGQVQMIYMDPPYGVKFGSNFQPFIRRRDVKHGDDADLTREPEMVQAYRDTWELGLHSYLTYMRDRLLLCRELLHPSGSIFVQISDENLHHVRELLDGVFGAENFCAVISFQKTGGQSTKLLASTVDYLLWYARDISRVKYRQLHAPRTTGDPSLDRYDQILLPDGSTGRLAAEEISGEAPIPSGRRYQLTSLLSDGESKTPQEFEFDGKKYRPRAGTHWKTSVEGLARLAKVGRIEVMGSVLRYRRFADDFPVVPLTDRWESTQLGVQLMYVVQTSPQVVQRCVLMTTDPGDLVLDPTCGSGTTAYVAEQWGRR